MIHIYLIRHGRQNSTLCNVDVELSSEGIRQAELLGERLSRYPIDGLYSSNLIRAKETAEIINQKLSLPLLIRNDIREISFGDLEGRTNSYIDEHFSHVKAAMMDLAEDIPFPGGENGTSVCERAMPVLEEIVRSGKKHIVVVTHGGVIRSLLAALFGKNQAKRFLYGISLENTSITELVYNEELDRYYLERFNDGAHLEPYEELHRKNWAN